MRGIIQQVPPVIMFRVDVADPDNPEDNKKVMGGKLVLQYDGNSGGIRTRFNDPHTGIEYEGIALVREDHIMWGDNDMDVSLEDAIDGALGIEEWEQIEAWYASMPE